MRLSRPALQLGPALESVTCPGTGRPCTGRGSKTGAVTRVTLARVTLQDSEAAAVTCVTLAGVTLQESKAGAVAHVTLAGVTLQDSKVVQTPDTRQYGGTSLPGVR
ncbi:hypothetical protein NDU88_000576 [Pleurodeles waltl]|uniref:Uncharacterized protein n=1 Tax=Pleurodeles waltl TaxID=8319 RepID=A0AAV7LV84_PLEWA|nr:hypothetical protein NDU88_000576 [Pleurodeles waltl]